MHTIAATLAECLISTILVVSPAVEGMENYLPTTWLLYPPIKGGLCIAKGNQEVEVEIVENRQIVILFARQRYEIALPPNAMTKRTAPDRSNEFRFIYVLGEQYARIGDQYKIMVRMGPVGFQ